MEKENEVKEVEPVVAAEETVVAEPVAETPVIDTGDESIGQHIVSPEVVKALEERHDAAVEAAKAPKAKKEVKEAKVEPKVEAKTEKKAEPKDPYKELQKEFTKRNQAELEMKKEMEAMRKALETLTKKPVDLKELAKDPEALTKHFQEKELEHQKVQQQIQAKAIGFETDIICAARSKDTENYPDWDKAQKLMEHYATAKDPAILNLDWTNPAKALDQAYELVKPLIEKTDWTKVPGYVAPAAPVPMISEEEVAKRVEEAERRGYERAQADAAERAKGGTVAGMNGRATSKRPLEVDPRKMSDKELEAYVKRGNDNYPQFQ